MQLDVLARDHYTRTALDSVALAIYFDGIRLDSTVTGPDGRALMNFAVSLLEGPGELPSDFSLSFNYPNPFHSETRVDLGVPESQSVRMEIYNILGQRVATQSLQLDAGNYALNLTLGHLPVGVYFLRVAGRDAKVEKMIKMGRTFSSPGPVFRMTPMGMGSPGRPVIDQKAGSGYLLSSDGGYQLRAWRDRYQHFETSPEIEGNPAELLVEMRRNNIVTIATVDPDEEPVSRQVRIRGEQMNLTINTPDTLILASGIYTVVSTTDSLFAVNDVFEIVSRDSAYVIRPFIPEDAEVSGQVANDQLEFVAGAQVKVYRDGSEYASTTTDPDGRYSTTLLGDGGLYSLVIYPPTGNGVFDPETYSGFSPAARVIMPLPGGSYELNFLLYTEPVLALPGGGTELPPGNYTLATDGGTVMVANIPPDLGIVGGTARAYSPTTTPDAFPGEFATRQQGVESGLVSGGFASVNLLRSNGAGGVEPISELRDESGNPVQVILKFRIDPADYHVIRDPATLSQLPGFINRADTIDVPLYYYDEQLGDWLLAPQFGWLENENGAIPMSALTAIQEGTYEEVIYTAGVVDHFTWYNLDYPTAAACMEGRLVDQGGKFIPFEKVTFQSMPEGGSYSFFSNISTATTDAKGYFRVTVPRTERGPGDDWNENNKVDNFRAFGRFEDEKACGVALFDKKGQGYATPDFPETTKCKNLGNLTVELKQAKKVDFEITFLDKEKENSPNYPLFVNPPAVSGANYAVATLLDLRIPLMGPIWKCACKKTDSPTFRVCKPETTTNESGVAFFTIPVVDEKVATPMIGSDYVHGSIGYMKTLPDLAFGAYEFANCNYEVPVNEKKETIRCEVSRRGPPVVSITKTGENSDFLYDELVTVEATGTSIRGESLNDYNFYWTNALETEFIASFRTVTRPAHQLFGTGNNLSIMAHGIDFYGYKGDALKTGLAVSEVEIEVFTDSDSIVPGDTARVTAVVSGASNTEVRWQSMTPSLASVNNMGEVIGLKPGTAVVRAYSLADPGKSDEVDIAVINLTANFTVSPAAGDSLTQFVFDASSSSGDITLYEWDFGDGNNTSGETAVHVYGISGVFMVKLTVTDGQGFKASVTRPVSATGQPYVVIQSSKTAGSVPLSVFFDGSGSLSPSGTITDWTWDFGDGNSAEGDTVTHTFVNTGDFIVRLTVTGSDGKTGVDSLEVRVTSPPVASFTVTPASGPAPLKVIVDATASVTGQGSIIAYHWNFGDGTTIDFGEAIETHTYTGLGLFEIGLTIETDLGSGSSATRAVDVGCEGIYDGDVIVSSIQQITFLQSLCRINGNVVLNAAGISLLPSFNNLLEISGNLTINMPDLEIISGFENLRESGWVKIENNPKLTEITGFSSLITTKILEISRNPLLTRIEAFNGLESVPSSFDGGVIEIYQNPNVSVLNAFSRLEQVESFGFSNSMISACQLANMAMELRARGVYMQIFDHPDMLWGTFEIRNQDDMNKLAGNCFVSSISIRDIQTALNGLEDLKWVNTLEIRNTRNVTALPEFPALSQINFLRVEGNRNLVNFSGIDNLIYLGEANIFNNEALISLSGLENLHDGFGIGISGNHALVDLTALNKIRKLDRLYIGSSNALTSLAGLESLEEVKNLDFWNLEGLVSLNALDGLRVTGNIGIRNMAIDRLPILEVISGPEFVLTISDNPNLIDLSGLESLQEADRIDIRRNNALQSLQGLNNLRYVEDNLIIERNPITTIQALESLEDVWIISLSHINVTDLSGLQNLTSLNRLDLSWLPDLQNIDALQNLSNIQEIDISRSSLADISGLAGLTGSVYSLKLSRLPNLSDLSALSGLTSVSHELNLHDLLSLTGLQGFENLHTVRDFDIGGLSSLTGLQGLENLNSVRDLHIYGNSNLVDLNQLTGLTSLTGLYIFNNPLLQNLDGLSSLSTLETIRIRNSPALTSLRGLSGLSSAKELTIDNTGLIDLEGLENITDHGWTTIINNSKLMHLDALANVGSVASLNIRNNSKLIHLDALANVGMVSNLEIRGNQELIRVSGMTGLNRINNSLTVSGNQQLPQCDVQLLIDQVQTRDGIGGTITTTGNNPDGVCEP